MATKFDWGAALRSVGSDLGEYANRRRQEQALAEQRAYDEKAWREHTAILEANRRENAATARGWGLADDPFVPVNGDLAKAHGVAPMATAPFGPIPGVQIPAMRRESRILEMMRALPKPEKAAAPKPRATGRQRPMDVGGIAVLQDEMTDGENTWWERGAQSFPSSATGEASSRPTGQQRVVDVGGVSVLQDEMTDGESTWWKRGTQKFPGESGGAEPLRQNRLHDYFTDQFGKPTQVTQQNRIPLYDESGRTAPRNKKERPVDYVQTVSQEPSATRGTMFDWQAISPDAYDLAGPLTTSADSLAALYPEMSGPALAEQAYNIHQPAMENRYNQYQADLARPTIMDVLERGNIKPLEAGGWEDTREPWQPSVDITGDQVAAWVRDNSEKFDGAGVSYSALKAFLEKDLGVQNATEYLGGAAPVLSQEKQAEANAKALLEDLKKTLGGVN
jgi:hypothetical protein